jgi:hypothetical protein
MAITVSHPFVSAKADGSDATLVKPSNWNANHTVVNTPGLILGDDALAPPPIASLLWGNQGNATDATNPGGAIYLYAQGAGSNSIRHLYKAPPAAPWTFTTALILVPTLSATYFSGGIALRESATGKLVTLRAGQDSNAKPLLALSKWNSYTSFSGDYFNNNCNLPTLIWIKVANDATHYTWSISVDGQSWLQLHQENLTDWFTAAADQAGIFIDAYNATYPTAILFCHWSGV